MDSNKYRLYFTFGSDPAFPYGRDEYVVVEAESVELAIHLFQLVHPNRPGSSCVNCAAWYFEGQFNELYDKYYPGASPAEVISLSVVRKGERSEG